jgi:hypothetical protein
MAGIITAAAHGVNLPAGVPQAGRRIKSQIPSTKPPGGGSTKHQIRNSKQIQMFKIQNPKPAYGPAPAFRSLGFWILDLFGIWNLVLGISAPRGEGFAALDYPARR